MLSRAERKKRRERILLERFIHATGLELQIVAGREAPDFHCRVEDREIGVELTEIFIFSGSRDDNLQAQEAIAEQIVVRALALYREAGGSHTHVSVLFGPGHDLRRLQREETAVALCQFVLAHALKPWDRFEWHPTTIDGPLPYEVSYVQGLGVPELDMAHWSSPRAGWVATLTSEMLSDAIAEKSGRLKSYTTNFSENWLVIVADVMSPSSSIRAGEHFEPASVRSPFDRTFFYQHPERAIELGAQNSRAQNAFR